MAVAFNAPINAISVSTTKPPTSKQPFRRLLKRITFTCRSKTTNLCKSIRVSNRALRGAFFLFLASLLIFLIYELSYFLFLRRNLGVPPHYSVGVESLRQSLNRSKIRINNGNHTMSKYLSSLKHHDLKLAPPTSSSPVHLQLGSKFSHVPLSTEFESVFDKVYVLSLPTCQHRWDLMNAWGKSNGLNLTRFRATSYDDIDMNNPPLPIINMPIDDHVTAGQIGCTMTHIRVWRDIFRNKYEHALVLEDDVMVTHNTLHNLPRIVKLADQASYSKGPWHYMYLRRHSFGNTNQEKLWIKGPGFPITIASPSWGTAAYVITLRGAEWLLSHMTYYQFPLDVQIEKIQRKFEGDFVALSACHNDHFQYLCPENIIEFSTEQKGQCSFSASQAGNRKVSTWFPRDLSRPH